jgi:hypothetical protein
MFLRLPCKYTLFYLSVYNVIRELFLPNLYDSQKDLGGANTIFKAHMLPDAITLPSGYVVQRPNKWK